MTAGDPEMDLLRWVREHAPVLASIRAEDGERVPLNGRTVAVSAPLTPHTGVFVETLRTAGADVVCCGEANTDHAAVVESLAKQNGITVFGEPGMDAEAYGPARDRLLAREPDYVCDDGAALLSRAHERHPRIAAGIRGAAEQTTSGVTRVRALDGDGELRCPVYDVNGASTKRLLDNRHGTAESTIAALSAVTERTLAGSVVVVAGYGPCGRGLAGKLRGIGARVLVTEVDPRRALAAHAAGHRVCPMSEAAAVGDVFLTATGNRNVLRAEHVTAMSDNSVLASAGTEDEIDVRGIAAAATDTTEFDGGIRYRFPDGRAVSVLAGGHPLNLAAPRASGNAAGVMDATFALLYAAIRDLHERAPDPGLRPLPARLDAEVAERKLDAAGVASDALRDAEN